MAELTDELPPSVSRLIDRATWSDGERALVVDYAHLERIPITPDLSALVLEAPDGTRFALNAHALALDPSMSWADQLQRPHPEFPHIKVSGRALINACAAL